MQIDLSAKPKTQIDDVIEVLTQILEGGVTYEHFQAATHAEKALKRAIKELASIQ